jgi:hypothetical protein
MGRLRGLQRVIDEAAHAPREAGEGLVFTPIHIPPPADTGLPAHANKFAVPRRAGNLVQHSGITP